jgi:hypothetical protein
MKILIFKLKKKRKKRKKEKKNVLSFFYQIDPFLLGITFYVLKALFKLLHTFPNRL